MDTDRTMELITALAAGDAEHGDVVAELRREGVDALDLMVHVLAAATRKGARAQPVPRDPARLSSETPPELRAAIVHPVPQLPFLLGGTLYDPADVVRFNGQELHFIAAPGEDRILAIDDRETMNRYWQLSMIAPMAVAADRKTLKAEPSGIGIESWPGDIESGPGGVQIGLGGHGPTTTPPPEAWSTFYEDDGNKGSKIQVYRGGAHPDLTEVAWTFLGTGDWNDTISSVRLFGTQEAILYEHVNFAGSTLTLRGDVSSLHPWGWNDRASGCSTS
jgi:hypothetical protein